MAVSRTSGVVFLATLAFLVLLLPQANCDTFDLEEATLKAAQDCLEYIAAYDINGDSGLHCNATFDGLTCWPYAEAGVVAVPCPGYIPDFNHEEMAIRVCEKSGLWKINAESNKTFVNYSACWNEAEPEEFNLEDAVTMYTVGYSLSLASLTIALIILIYFKRLHCTRNYVHMHLFVSFMLRATMVLVRDKALYSEGGTRSTPGCKVVQTIFMYFMATNYFWILVEGLYLHNLIFFSVFTERKVLKWFVAIGWGFPVLFVIPWAVVRAKLADEKCWDDVDEFGYIWIYKSFIVATIGINFLLFVNIIRVLVKKLRHPASVGSQRRSRWCCNCPRGTNGGSSNRSDGRRSSVQMQMPIILAKSTLVLIPLFGVHYIVFVGMPESERGLAYSVRMFFDLFFNSFQGFFVSVLYCFLNGEVRQEFKKRWERWRMGRDILSSRTQAGYSTAQTYTNANQTRLLPDRDDLGDSSIGPGRKKRGSSIPTPRESVDYIKQNERNNDKFFHTSSSDSNTNGTTSPKSVSFQLFSEIRKKFSTRRRTEETRVHRDVIHEEGENDNDVELCQHPGTSDLEDIKMAVVEKVTVL
uniref:Parathyroid hormone receptor-like protein bf98B n=1 Tax=Branchiostoma floridae TaxID=7739 RepID=A0A0E3TI51_BRAFL|nr:parathyroid hormone receptor-like protein bf98B [Branchiostoma floridae]